MNSSLTDGCAKGSPAVQQNLSRNCVCKERPHRLLGESGEAKLFKRFFQLPREPGAFQGPGRPSGASELATIWAVILRALFPPVSDPLVPPPSLTHTHVCFKGSSMAAGGWLGILDGPQVWPELKFRAERRAKEGREMRIQFYMGVS